MSTLLESKNPRVTQVLAGLGIRSHGIREVVRANGLIRVAVREVYFNDYWLSQLVEIRDLFLAIEWTPEGLRLVFKDESLEPRPEGWWFVGEESPKPAVSDANVDIDYCNKRAWLNND